MREEFLITRSGKQYVLFSGLLDEAHSRGVREIKTTLLQIPSAENGNVAIVHARVVMDHLSEPDNPLRNSFGGEYSDGDHPRLVERAFEGIGDASPENVGRSIAPHIIRMAETRAKARALRDAVNVSAVALEELSDGEESAPTRPATSPQRVPERRQESDPTPISQGRQTRSHRDANKTPGGALVEDANNLIELLSRNGKKKAEEGPRVYKLSQSEVEAETAQYQERGSG